MVRPRVSVVMAVYNGQPFLSSALDSILAQTFTDFEFLIVNDGSTDETAAILQRYARQEGRLKVINLPQNIGIARAHNLALGLAQGEYLALQDADDISMPTRLSAEAALLDAQPELGLVGAIPDVIDHAGALLGREHRFGTSNPVLQQQLLNNCCFCHGSLMFRRSLLEKIGPYDPALEPADDYDFVLRLAEVAEVANMDAPLYQYRMHSDSISRRRQAQQIQRAGVALERAAFRRHGPHPPAGRLEVAATYYLRAAIIGHLASNADIAQPSLARASELWPTILGEAEPLSQLLANETSGRTNEESLAISHAVFDGLLPKSARLARRRRQFEAQVNMREVFGSWHQRDYQYVKPYLRAGLAADPRWLLNRGVLRYLMSAMLQGH